MRRQRGWRGCDRSRPMQMPQKSAPALVSNGNSSCRGDPLRSPSSDFDYEDYARNTVIGVPFGCRIMIINVRGAYFVTIVTQNRTCLFGDVVDGRSHLNLCGQMIARRFGISYQQHYPKRNRTDTFVIMPNHVHGIIALVGVGACADIQSGGQPQGVAPTIDPRPKHDAVSCSVIGRYRPSIQICLTTNALCRRCQTI